jgi:hypothetical protein
VVGRDDITRLRRQGIAKFFFQRFQDQKLTSVSFENSRYARQTQTLQRKLEEVEAENKSIEAENQVRPQFRGRQSLTSRVKFECTNKHGFPRRTSLRFLDTIYVVVIFSASKN